MSIGSPEITPTGEGRGTDYVDRCLTPVSPVGEDVHLIWSPRVQTEVEHSSPGVIDTSRTPHNESNDFRITRRPILLSV